MLEIVVEGKHWVMDLCGEDFCGAFLGVNGVLEIQFKRVFTAGW